MLNTTNQPKERRKTKVVSHTPSLKKFMLEKEYNSASQLPEMQVVVKFSYGLQPLDRVHVLLINVRMVKSVTLKL